ncbi:MAG: hypothetical protein LUF81_07480 [Clostridiales bacterium]|nr:hypothetical protein [Clostridiales bacterium]
MSSRVRRSGGGRRVRPASGSWAEEVRQKDRAAGRLLRQLGVALAIFALWMGLRQSLPDQAAVWGSALDRLLTGTADLREAFAQLGEDLSQGEGVAVAVGNWCETVFLPEETEETDETDETDGTDGTEGTGELTEPQLENGGAA